jgi:hypothetical protein
LLFLRGMTVFGHPQWFVAGEACALCDEERHLAHIVRAGNKWFAFDATHPNGEGVGCLFLGSFVRRLSAMAAAETETLHKEVSAPESPDTSRVRELTLGMLKNRSRREHVRHSDAA